MNRLDSTHVICHIDVKEVMMRSPKTIEKVTCPSCNGAGYDYTLPDSAMCPMCSGDGVVADSQVENINNDWEEDY